jgi:hypothetical protein
MHVKLNYTGAWMPFDALHHPAANSRLATWITENWQSNFDDRVVITPQISGNSVETTELLSALADGAPWVSPRTDRGARVGPVVAAWPTEETLAHCVRRANNSSLVVLEWGKSPAVLGWATAVQAFNAEAGEPTPPLPSKLHDVFADMLFRDDYLSEGAKAGRHREITQGHLRELKAAGLTQDFIVTYLIALGFHGNMRRLREHCQVAGIKKIHFTLPRR